MREITRRELRFVERVGMYLIQGMVEIGIAHFGPPVEGKIDGTSLSLPYCWKFVLLTEVADNAWGANASRGDRIIPMLARPPHTPAAAHTRSALDLDQLDKLPLESLRIFAHLRGPKIWQGCSKEKSTFI